MQDIPRNFNEFLATFIDQLDAGTRQRATQEADMDIRTPPLTREEAKLALEQRLNDWLDMACAELPGQGRAEDARRDITMRLAIKAFGGQYFDDERNILTALHAIDRMNPYDPGEALFWLEKAQRVAEDRMKEAERGVAPGIYTEWCMINQIADEELDEARERAA